MSNKNNNNKNNDNNNNNNNDILYFKKVLVISFAYVNFDYFKMWKLIQEKKNIGIDLKDKDKCDFLIEELKLNLDDYVSIYEYSKDTDNEVLTTEKGIPLLIIKKEDYVNFLEENNKINKMC